MRSLISFRISIAVYELFQLIHKWFPGRNIAAATCFQNGGKPSTPLKYHIEENEAQKRWNSAGYGVDLEISGDAKK